MRGRLPTARVGTVATSRRRAAEQADEGHPSMTVEIRRAEPRDLPAVRTVLAGALADDPLMAWIFGTTPHRPSAVAVFLSQAIERYVLAGTVWLAIVGGRAVGGATWRVPGTAPAGADAGDTLPGQHVLELIVGRERAAVVRDGFAAMGDLAEPEES